MKSRYDLTAITNRCRRWLRWPYLGLLLTLLLYLSLATVYLVVTPPLAGFDAIAHMNHINYLRKFRQLPPIDHTTAEFSYELLTQPPLYYAVAALASVGTPYVDADRQTRAQANTYFPGLSKQQSIMLPTTPDAVHRAWLIARLVSLLGGVITVATSWLWVRAVAPGQTGLATAVATFVALNPLFLFISTSVTNDGWAAAGMAAVIWLTTVLAQRPQATKAQWFTLGCVAGLAALTKYSVLLVALPALLILLQQRRLSTWRSALSVVLPILGGVVLTAGFWYGRNLLLYRELIPLNAMSAIITTLQRPTLMSWDQVWTLLPFLFYSYWGLFVAIFAPAPFFRFVQILTLIGVAGWLISPFRSPTRRLTAPLLLALLWFGATLVSMINYMRLISFGEQARFLLPAAPAMGLLLMVGWRGWLPQRYWPQLSQLIVLCFVGVALWPLPTLRAQFALPGLVAADFTPPRPINATFAGGMTVTGYALPQGAAFAAGEELPLKLYLTSAAPVSDDYTFFLQLVDAEDRILYQYDGAPAGGRYPTRAWQPNATFVDDYTLTVAPLPGEETLATLILGFYPFGRPNQRLPVYDQAGVPIGDRLLLGQVRLLPQAPTLLPAPATAVAHWAAGITLAAAQVTLATGRAGAVDVQLQWQSAQLLHRDYTVFVQLLNPAGEIVGQYDGQPRNGQAPTSTWLVGEPIADHYFVTASAPWRQVIVGFYDAQSGVRLPLATGSSAPDFAIIAPVTR